MKVHLWSTWRFTFESQCHLFHFYVYKSSLNHSVFNMFKIEFNQWCLLLNKIWKLVLTKQRNVAKIYISFDYSLPIALSLFLSNCLNIVDIFVSIQENQGNFQGSDQWVVWAIVQGQKKNL